MVSHTGLDFKSSKWSGGKETHLFIDLEGFCLYVTFVNIPWNQGIQRSSTNKLQEEKSVESSWLNIPMCKDLVHRKQCKASQYFMLINILVCFSVAVVGTLTKDNLEKKRFISSYR